MHVRCPHCQTVFRLPPGALEAAGGRLRCGCCDALFDGRLAQVPAYHDAREVHRYRTDRARREPAREAAGRERPPPRPAADPPPAPEEVLGLARELLPEPRPVRPPARTLLLTFSNVLLAGLLGVQLLLGLRAPLLASPELRPWLERGCALAGCRLPALRDPDQVEILARDIRTHPRYANGLLVDVTIVNRAPYVQPFPVLQLTFTSLDEQWFAQRRFQPAEYLGPNRGTAERLPPDIPVQVVLELLDPGPEAVSFAFDFL